MLAWETEKTPQTEENKKMEKRFCKIDVYNRLKALKEIRKELSNMGATLLRRGYYKKYEMEVYTNDTDTDKIERLKRECKNIFVLRGDCGEGLQLEFVLDGFYYYISYDSNPFMPIMYQKIKINENGSYNGARYLYSSEELNNRSWAEKKELCFSFGYDNFFKICKSEDIKEIALYHLEQIKKEIIPGCESASYTDNYHPRNAEYSIYKDPHNMNDYACVKMTAAELEL